MKPIMLTLCTWHLSILTLLSTCTKMDFADLAAISVEKEKPASTEPASAGSEANMSLLDVLKPAKRAELS